jgi:hypothetical protein
LFLIEGGGGGVGIFVASGGGTGCLFAGQVERQSIAARLHRLHSLVAGKSLNKTTTTTATDDACNFLAVVSNCACGGTFLAVFYLRPWLVD